MHQPGIRLISDAFGLVYCLYCQLKVNRDVDMQHIPHARYLETNSRLILNRKIRSCECMTWDDLTHSLLNELRVTADSEDPGVWPHSLRQCGDCAGVRTYI